MKRILFILLASCLLLCGCSKSDFDDGYEKGYKNGYNQAESEFSSNYRDILFEGAYEAKDDFAMAVASEYGYEIVRGISTKYGLHPEEAIMILNDFQNGEHVTAEDLRLAIDVVTEFYYTLDSFIYDIEDLDFEFDFD